MCVPRSIDPSTTSPIKSRLKSVLGSVLPSSNAIIIVIIINSEHCLLPEEVQKCVLRCLRQDGLTQEEIDHLNSTLLLYLTIVG